MIIIFQIIYFDIYLILLKNENCEKYDFSFNSMLKFSLEH